MLFRYMQPWKPTKILHIGLTDPSTRDLEARWWGKPKPKPKSSGSKTAGAGAGVGGTGADAAARTFKKSISEVDVGSDGDAGNIHEAPKSNYEPQVRTKPLQ